MDRLRLVVFGIGRCRVRCGSLDIAGQSYDAASCFINSRQFFTESCEEIDQAWLLRDWAAYEWRQGNRSRGQARWQEAQEIFARLGLDLELERMAAEASSFAAQEE